MQVYKLLIVAALIGVVLCYDCGVHPTCVDSGGSCAAIQSECKNGLYCNRTAVCTPVVNVGEACDQDMACKDHPIGATLCWHGVCQATTRNHTEGEPCSWLNKCENAFYCNNTEGNYAVGTCLKFLAKGDDCKTERDRCGSQLICNLGTCVDYFSVAIGGACDTTTFFSVISACVADSYCSYNTTTRTGSCVKGFTSSNTPCNQTCTDSREVCVCQNYKQKCIGPRIATPSQAKDFSKLDACINSSNCDIGDINCCHEYQCTYYDILGGGYEPECGYSNPWSFCSKSGLTQAEKIGIVAAIVVGVALIIALVVFAFRRRKQSHYSKI